MWSQQCCEYSPGRFFQAVQKVHREESVSVSLDLFIASSRRFLAHSWKVVSRCRSKIPRTGSRLQLLRPEISSHVGVSSVHGYRGSALSLASNMLKCPLRATWSGASIPSGLEMPTGRSKINYSSTNSPRHQTPSISTHPQPSKTEIPSSTRIQLR